MSEQQVLVISTTITITSVVPFDADHYHGMNLAEAMDYERDMAKDDNIADCLDDFMQSMQSATFDCNHIPTIRDPKGDLSISVRVEDVV